MSAWVYPGVTGISSNHSTHRNSQYYGAAYSLCTKETSGGAKMVEDNLRDVLVRLKRIRHLAANHGVKVRQVFLL